ncbi:hypothetical protein [Maribacter arcticus]|uniref:Uncharacterized protein n=1 Tax=Maribacter arcticus TaxID=561365 RepID=A0A1T5AE08_9FLAO|nr:hypothetical protein [Maribacter arcticus]SKB33272.1 hypothetical protein SAMN05660866_00881 [Maribacter arcticus]
MKKSLLKFLLSICILLSSICSPLFANFNIENTSLHTIAYQNTLSTNTDLTSNVHNQNAIISGTSDKVDKVLEIDAAEIEEEESENTFFKKGEKVYYTSASFYLLSILFLFSYLKNSTKLLMLFTIYPLVNRRFVLYQVFRL